MDPLDTIQYPVKLTTTIEDTAPLVVLIFISYALLMICFLQISWRPLLSQTTARH